MQSENPFKGPSPYKDGDKIYGRDKEKKELSNFIRNETLTILFSRSGTGKTSLLKAGLIPHLRNNYYLPIYIHLSELSKGNTSESEIFVKNIIQLITNEAEVFKDDNNAYKITIPENLLAKNGSPSLFQFISEFRIMKLEDTESSENISEIIPETIPKTIPKTVPVIDTEIDPMNISNTTTKTAIENIPETIPETAPETILEIIPEIINEITKEAIMIKPVLIFDQFEEIFSLPFNNNVKSLDFLLDEIDALIENHVPDYLHETLKSNSEQYQRIKSSLLSKQKSFRILFSFREEYLPQFESLKRKISFIRYTNSRYRLEPFDELTAEEIITNTAPEIDRKIAKSIVDSLATNIYSNFENKSVDPFLLSLVCQKLYPKIIIKDKLKEEYDSYWIDSLVVNAIEDYVESVYRVINNETKIFIEEKLLTTDGKRTPFNYEEASKETKIKNDLELLAGESSGIELNKKYFYRLLNIEQFLDSLHIEILHDRLLPPIIKRRHERREQNERQLLIQNQIEIENNFKKRKETWIKVNIVIAGLVLLGFFIIGYIKNYRKTVDLSSRFTKTRETKLLKYLNESNGPFASTIEGVNYYSDIKQSVSSFFSFGYEKPLFDSIDLLIKSYYNTSPYFAKFNTNNLYSNINTFAIDNKFMYGVGDDSIFRINILKSEIDQKIKLPSQIINSGAGYSHQTDYSSQRLHLQYNFPIIAKNKLFILVNDWLYCYDITHSLHLNYSIYIQNARSINLAQNGRYLFISRIINERTAYYLFSTDAAKPESIEISLPLNENIKNIVSYGSENDSLIIYTISTLFNSPLSSNVNKEIFINGIINTVTPVINQSIFPNQKIIFSNNNSLIFVRSDSLVDWDIFDLGQKIPKSIYKIPREIDKPLDLFSSNGKLFYLGMSSNVLKKGLVYNRQDTLKNVYHATPINIYFDDFESQKRDTVKDFSEFKFLSLNPNLNSTNSWSQVTAVKANNFTYSGFFYKNKNIIYLNSFSSSSNVFISDTDINLGLIIPSIFGGYYYNYFRNRGYLWIFNRDSLTNYNQIVKFVKTTSEVIDLKDPDFPTLVVH